MKFSFNGRKIEITDPLKEYAEKKLSKLDKFFSGDAEATVVCSKERGRFTTDVTVRASNLFFVARNTANDVYATIDEVQEMIERQIRRHKTKLGKRVRQNVIEDTLPEEFQEDTYEVIRTKRFEVESMDVEEAILRMNLLNHNFFVFRNAEENDKTCVVYARKVDGYGLIECD